MVKKKRGKKVAATCTSPAPQSRPAEDGIPLGQQPEKPIDTKRRWLPWKQAVVLKTLPNQSYAVALREVKNTRLPPANPRLVT